MGRFELVTTKYGAELAPVDFGHKRKFQWVHKYKYRGEQREKVKEIVGPEAMMLSASTLRVRGLRPYYEWVEVPLDAEVIIWEEVT